MGFMNSKKRIAVIAAVVTSLAAGSIAYAATTVKLDAYYDTFKMKVSGTEQFISAREQKPFIADSRIYIPLATLNQLGVVDATWDAASASVNIVPKGGASNSGEIALYQQQIAAFTTQLQQKNTEVDKLKAENENLKAQVDKLEDEVDSSTSTTDVRDFEEMLLDDRDYNRYSGPTEVGTLYFDYEVDEYRGDIEINMYIEDELNADELEALRDDFRNFDYLIEDIAMDAEDEFPDAEIIITVYNGDIRSNPDDIEEYTFDGRLRGSIQ